MLTAYLIVLPFNTGFDQMSSLEWMAAIATFFCALVCPTLFTALAV